MCLAGLLQITVFKAESENNAYPSDDTECLRLLCLLFFQPRSIRPGSIAGATSSVCILNVTV